MKIYFLIFFLLYSHTTGQTNNRRVTNTNSQYSQNRVNQRTNHQPTRTSRPILTNRRPNIYYPPAEKTPNQYRPGDQSSQIAQNIPTRDQSSPNKQDIPKYICSIQYDGIEECSCAITSTTTIVTAAHCVYEKNSNYYQVAVGSGFNKKYDVVSTNYKNFVYQYPYYDDIVELTLSNPIEISSDIAIVATPSKEECFKSVYGNDASIWGPTDKNSPSILSEITVKILKPADRGCSTYYNYKQLSPKMFCAGWNDGRIDPCKANDGSPIIFNGKLYGIATWGKGCKRPTQASVYADFCRFTYNYTDPDDEYFTDYMNEFENYDDPVDNY